MVPVSTVSEGEGRDNDLNVVSAGVVAGAELLIMN